MRKFKREACGYIRDMFVQHNMVRRSFMSLLSIVFMGFGISLFSLSGFGVDPFTSMNMNISSSLGIGYGTYQLIVNAVIIVFVVIVAHRGLVGLGTMLNMVGVGYTCELFQKLITPYFETVGSSVVARAVLLAVGIIVLCFSCSLFFTSNVGVGPYDALGFMLNQKTGLSYKWIRVITDILVIAIGLVVSGGIKALFDGDFTHIKNIGIGTIITAFMMGPLVNYFSKHICSKILDFDYAKLSKKVAFFMIKGALLKSAYRSLDNPEKLNMNSNAYEVLKEF